MRGLPGRLAGFLARFPHHVAAAACWQTNRDKADRREPPEPRVLSGHLNSFLVEQVAEI